MKKCSVVWYGTVWYTLFNHADPYNIKLFVRYDPFWTKRKNSLELIEISSINKVGLVLVSCVLILNSNSINIEFKFNSFSEQHIESDIKQK